MKKLLFAFPIVALLAAGCNSSKQTSNQAPVPSPVVQNTNSASTPTPISTPSPTPISTSSQNTQAYTGTGFTFQYPKSWQVNYTNYPSKNPTSCGDPNGDALLCAAFAPSSVATSYKQKYGNIDFAVMEITVFQTQLSFQAWCGAHAFGCSGPTTVNGYQAFYSTDVDPEAYSRESYIIYGNGAVVVFEFDKYEKAVPYGQPVEITDNSQYEPIFDNIVNSIQFSK